VANKMADKKKTTSQSTTRSANQMAEMKARSDEKEPSKVVKATASAKDERKVQQSKPVRRESKSSARWTRWRSNRYVRFVLDAYYELRHKVTWPSFNEARNMTIAVILLSVAIGLILGAADLGLYQIFLLLSHVGGAK
jgi:preprotein translocase SecE subunit